MMSQLKDILLEEKKRQHVVQDCAHLVDTEVGQKGGLSGLAIKGAYALVKRLKPGFIEDVCNNLLDEFVEKLEPFYADFKSQAGNQPITVHWVNKAPDIANALLAITDARAQKTDNATLKKAYAKLRPTGVKHVEAAVPGIARVIAKYV